jgi:hypothetical protein
VLDGADGDLARMTGRASPAGELIDGVCDYLSHMFLYTLLSIFLFDSIGHWAWPVTLAAGISRIFQANHSESQRRIYLWRVCGIPWLRQAEPANKDVFERSGPVQLLFTGLGQAYVALAEKVSPLSVEVDEAVERASSPRSRERVRRLCRRAGRTSLRLQSWLGANPRTILLGLSMAAGTPLYYFLVELIPLNLLLLWSIRHQKSCNLRLAKQLSGSPLVRSTTRAG